MKRSIEQGAQLCTVSTGGGCSNGEIKKCLCSRLKM